MAEAVRHIGLSLGADLCCALLHEDAVSLHKLATHLSVV